MTAQEAYAIEYKRIGEIMRLIQDGLKEHRAINGTSEKWAAAGDLLHVQGDLEVIAKFLGKNPYK